MTAGLDDASLALVQEAIGRHGSIEKVARLIGYARPSLSLAMRGRYAGSLEAMEAAIHGTLASRVACPHLGREISGEDCRGYRERPIPTADRAALKHWTACRFCPRNPDQSPSQQENRDAQHRS